MEPGYRLVVQQRPPMNCAAAAASLHPRAPVHSFHAAAAFTSCSTAHLSQRLIEGKLPVRGGTAFPWAALRRVAEWWEAPVTSERRQIVARPADGRRTMNWTAAIPVYCQAGRRGSKSKPGQQPRGTAAALHLLHPSRGQQTVPSCAAPHVKGQREVAAAKEAVFLGVECALAEAAALLVPVEQVSGACGVRCGKVRQGRRISQLS